MLVDQQAIGFTPMVLTNNLAIVEGRVPTDAANEKPLGLSQGTLTSVLFDQLVDCLSMNKASIAIDLRIEIALDLRGGGGTARARVVASLKHAVQTIHQHYCAIALEEPILGVIQQTQRSFLW